MAAPKSKDFNEKPIAQRPMQKNIPVARTGADASKAGDDVPYTGSAPSTYEYIKPFSKEWYQHQEEEERRINSLLTICRGC